MLEKILFIHGFASVGHGVKSLQLKQWFGNDVFAPDLNHRPLADLDDLSALIKILLYNLRKLYRNILAP